MIVEVGQIITHCDCGKCPAWIKDAIGQFALFVTEPNGKRRIFGPYPDLNTATAEVHTIVEFVRADRDYRENSPHLH